MGWTKLGVLILFLVVIFTVSIFGGHWNYNVDGVPVSKVSSSGSPGLLGVFGWAWDSVSFIWDMMLFNIDGMPTIINVIFIVMGLVVLYMIIELIVEAIP